MGYQDRHYYRDRGSGAGNPLIWLMTGSVPLFTAFGIRVRAHAAMLLFIALTLLLGAEQGMGIADRAQSMTVLFAVVLLHEFGHCFAARWVGGDADEILMHPLGGLALAHPPRRPLPTFITVAGGPAVNLLICLIAGIVLAFYGAHFEANPFRFHIHLTYNASNVAWYVAWIFQISYMLLMFNLLPIFPLDGGQMLQTILWPRIGYYRSMLFSTAVGLIGSVIFGVLGLLFWNFWILAIAAMGFMYCLQLRRALIATGPEEYADDSIDYSAAYETFSKPKRKSKWAAKRAMKLARAERIEQRKIDEILAKVSAHGMHSLSWSEKRVLKKATEHQRKRDIEMGQIRRH